MLKEKHILERMLGRLTDSAFLQACGLTEARLPTAVGELVQAAVQETNAQKLELALMPLWWFPDRQADFVSEFEWLLAMDFHTCHEDIALALERVAAPSSVGVLYTTALRKFDYLDYNNSEALARKCVWGLRKIADGGSIEALDRLRLLAQSEDEAVRRFAQKHLDDLKI